MTDLPRYWSFNSSANVAADALVSGGKNPCLTSSGQSQFIAIVAN